MTPPLKFSVHFPTVVYLPIPDGPSKPLAPALASVSPTSMRRDATQQQRSAPPVHLRSSLDQHMSLLYPNHWQPTSQEAMRAALYVRGATDDTLLVHLEQLNSEWDKIFAQYPDGKLPTLGVRTV